jgi:GxxExxY protein
MNHEGTEARRRHINDLSHQVIGFCIEVHRHLGPGLLESAYEEALAFEFAQARLKFERQLEVPLAYKGVALSCGYRLDFLVDQELILELKSVAEILPVHQAQLLTYLKLQNRPLGLLVNFNSPVLKNGIHRIVHGPLFQNV